MLLMTLLNRRYRFKGFVYRSALFAEGGHKAVELQVRGHRGSRPNCRLRGCVGHDRLVCFIPADECNARNAAMRRGG